jgi:hypothetical protein
MCEIKRYKVGSYRMAEHGDMIFYDDHLTAMQQARINAVRLLDAAACPCCDKSGAYYDNYGQVYQCQWCYEVEQLKEQRE